jgi:phage terminase large subunit-like protein
LVPPRSGSVGADAVELARSAGLILDPWQELVLDTTFSERPDNKWAAMEVGLVVPRQNGKGSILEAIELAGLFLLNEQLILHSAHEFKTAQEAFLRIRGVIEGCPSLMRKVSRVRTAAGEQAIELKTGARLRFLARSAGSGRGFSGDRVVLDEAYRLSPQMMAALFPTLSARPNPQVIYATSSPPEVDEYSEQIRNLKRRAESDDPGRLAWIEWSNPVNVDPDDREAWARANPALGIRIDAEFVETERATMPHEAFMVERLGVWRSVSLSSKIPQHLWEAIESDTSPSPEDACFAIDIPPARDSASVAVCDGETFELADRRPGTEWVLPRCIELWDKYAPLAFVVDGAGPAAGLVADLEASGLRVVVTNSRDMAAACGRLFDAVTNRTVAHTGQAPLTAAVLGSATRQLGDAWAWSRTRSAVDIAPLVAATLALWGAATLQAPPEADPMLMLL